MSYHLIHIKTGSEDLSLIDSNKIVPTGKGYADKEEISDPESESIEWSGTCKICGETICFRLLGSEDRKRKVTKLIFADIGWLFAIILFGYIIYNILIPLFNLYSLRLFVALIFGSAMLALIGDIFSRGKSKKIIVEKKSNDMRHDLIHDFVLEGIIPDE